MKIEKKPLLAEGFKEITLFQLDAYFLDPFAEKEVRVRLINKLRDYLELFRTLKLDAEVWLDGSFTTQKEEPGDVDLAILLDMKEVDALSADKQVLFRNLLLEREKVKIRYLLDVYFVDKSSERQKAQFISYFGFERDSVNKKGIFKLRMQ